MADRSRELVEELIRKTQERVVLWDETARPDVYLAVTTTEDTASSYRIERHDTRRPRRRSAGVVTTEEVLRGLRATPFNAGLGLQQPPGASEPEGSYYEYTLHGEIGEPPRTKVDLRADYGDPLWEPLARLFALAQESPQSAISRMLEDLRQVR